jgi:hypothetical protein
MGTLHSKYPKASCFCHNPYLFLFSSIEIQRSASKGNLEEVGTMSKVWLLVLAIVLVNSSYKKK